MIIIPDVHGRTFWKQAVAQAEPNEEIIFLGDYVDPYYHEGISNIDALNNFKEIIDFAKNNANVTLLLGNHDFMTYLSKLMGNCRTDIDNAAIIGKLITDNIDLFKVATYRTINETTYTFSHAPITHDWVNSEMCKYIHRTGIFHNIHDKNDPKEIIDILNDTWKNNREQLYVALDYVSLYRGGRDDTGSIVWSDVRELSTTTNTWPGYYMIFGHTQLHKELIAYGWACLDCRRAFRIDFEGEIIPITQTTPIAIL